MSSGTSNVLTAGLFAGCVVFLVMVASYDAGSAFLLTIEFGAMFAVVYVLAAKWMGCDARTAIVRVLFAIGVVWAGFAWACWPVMPNRGYETALTSAVILAPAYLLVAIRRGHGVGMRVFVAVALAILIVRGTRPGFGRYLDLIDLRPTNLAFGGSYELVEEYTLLPPLAALTVKAILWRLKRPIPPGHCKTCRYNLTGNVSGVCPECGTPVARELRKGDVQDV
jgi:hypothetical protein